MAKGNSIDKDDPKVNDQGFKKTETTVQPSADKEPIPNPADEYMKKDLPVHDANVADLGHDIKNGQKHDMENKYNVQTKDK